MEPERKEEAITPTTVIFRNMDMGMMAGVGGRKDEKEKV